MSVYDEGLEVYNQIKYSLYSHAGDYVAIDPKSKEHWIGATLTEALNKARKAYPGRTFFATRIGSDVVEEFKR